MATFQLLRRELYKNELSGFTLVARGQSTATGDETVTTNIVLPFNDLPAVEFLNGRFWGSAVNTDWGTGNLLSLVTFRDMDLQSQMRIHSVSAINTNRVYSEYLPHEFTTGTAISTFIMGPVTLANDTDGLVFLFSDTGGGQVRLTMDIITSGGTVGTMTLDWFMHLNFRDVGGSVPMGLS